MNSKALLAASVTADVLDCLVVGQIPVVGHLLDVPVMIMHFMAGGPAAALCLVEAIPVVGTLPVFTFFAWRYHKTGRYAE